MTILLELEVNKDGIDGAGKTTVQKKFKKLLEATKIPHAITRESGNPYSKACSQLREIALSPIYQLGPEAMECVFAAQRFLNYDWYSQLNTSTLVLSDRGLLSHFCYGYAALPREQIDALFKTYCKSINEKMKSYVIYLRIDPEIAAQRIIARGGETDNVELLGLEHQKKVAANFELLLQDPTLSHHVWIVDANKDEEDVQQQLEKIFEQVKSLWKTQNTYQ